MIMENDDNVEEQGRRWLLPALALGAAGFAANFFGLEIFFNVELLFGSFFSSFALLRYGPRAGVLAGVVAAASTVPVLQHPWFWPVLCGEALFLARFLKRTRNPVQLDVLFWFFGAPVIWILYRDLLGVPAQSATLVMLKHAINGILNVLLASIVQLALQYRQHAPHRLPKLRHVVFSSMVALVLALVLADLMIDLRNQM